MKRPTRIPPASHDRGLKMVLFVFIIAGLWLSWVLTVNPNALFQSRTGGSALT